ncbi:MAG: hypothetical protein QM478_01935 [Flavobacteriaceae bacterium]
MKIIVVVPKNLFGNWVKQIVVKNKKIQLDVFVLNNFPENRLYKLFFKIDQKLFKGAKSLVAPIDSVNQYNIDNVKDITIDKLSTCILNFTDIRIESQNISQYEFFVNQSTSIFNELIKSTILTKYKKVSLQVKNKNKEFETSVRFDPISVSKNLDLVLATFLGIIKSNLQALQDLDKSTNVAISGLNVLSVFKYGVRFCKKIIDYKFYADQWLIAYQFGDESKISLFNFETIKKIIPPKDRFWADPIVIFENDTYYVFIEELLYANDKGHISVFEIHKNGSVTQPVKIIENDYHMSYPFVFKYEEDYYMIPETSHNSTIDLYRAKNFPYEWKFEKTIFNNIQATDTTLVYANHKWWMFTSIKEFENGTYDNVLSIFYADNPIKGNWKAHEQNIVKNDIENSRQGGPFFKGNDCLYRISQNGMNTYGFGYNIHKVIELSETTFKEELVNNYTATDKGIIGVHTFNKVENIQVYDVLKRIKKIEFVK